MSCTTPISLFTCISETSCVSARKRRAHLLRPHDAVGLRFQPGDFEAFALQLLQRIEHGLVLGLGRNEVSAAIGVEARDAEDREVVRLGRAGSPDDAVRPRADRRGDLRARLSRPARARAGRTRGRPKTDCRARRSGADIRSSRRRRADRPASSPRNRDRSWLLCSLLRRIRKLRDAVTPLLSSRRHCASWRAAAAPEPPSARRAGCSSRSDRAARD